MSAEPRAGLRDLGPYASPQHDVAVRLNTNESPHPLPESFFDELAKAVHDLPLHRYPDGGLTRLREELAAATHHGADGIWAANGSNEIITQLLQAYGGPGRRAVTFEPTYPLHSRLCWLTHTDVTPLALPGDFVVGEPQVAAVLDIAPDIVFVCSPNNPTGNAQPLSVVAEIAERLPRALVMVDEAYGEFAPASSAQALIGSHDNIVIVRTFSKAYAMAGARIGYALADPGVIEDLRVVRLPYHLSALTQTAAIAALHHREEAAAMLGGIRVQRDRIVRELRTLGLVVHPSDANFVLFEVEDVAAIWHGLLDRGVLIRDVSAAVPRGLRVTAGAEHETDRFLDAMREMLGR
jgi:histidinol-phosphate aminotransferase